MTGLTSNEINLDNYLYLQVPNDYREFNLRLVNMNHNIDYKDIKYVKHYDWAISHLQDKQYEDIFESYQSFEKEVKKYNRIIVSIKSFLTKKLEKDVRYIPKDFKNDDDLLLDNSYSIENLVNKLTQLLNPIKNDEDPRFEEIVKEFKFENSYYIEIKNLRFIKSTNQNPNLSLIIEILNSITADKLLKNKFNKLRKKWMKIVNLEKDFNKKIMLLTEDIDAGDLLKGFCKIGF
jgi:hypothetical protein